MSEGMCGRPFFKSSRSCRFFYHCRVAEGLHVALMIRTEEETLKRASLMSTGGLDGPSKKAPICVADQLATVRMPTNALFRFSFSLFGDGQQCLWSFISCVDGGVVKFASLPFFLFVRLM